MMGSRSHKGMKLPIDWDTSRTEIHSTNIPSRDRAKNLPSRLGDEAFQSTQNGKPGMYEKFQFANPSDQHNLHPEALVSAEYLRKPQGIDNPGSQPRALRIELSQTGWKPDMYADSFIPQSLKVINQLPAITIDTPPIEAIEYGKYIATFAGNEFLSMIETPPLPQSLETTSLESLANLSPSTYRSHFSRALAVDVAARAPENRSYDLFAVPVQLQDNLKQVFSMRVPGLGDGTPIVNFGDTITIRQLAMDHTNGYAFGMDARLFVGGAQERGEQAPGFTGYQLNAIVTGVDKRAEILFFRALGMIWAEQLFCNVSFIVQRRILDASQKAVFDVAQEITLDNPSGPHKSEARFDCSKSLHTTPGQKGDTSTWLHRVLFPEDDNGIQQTDLPSVIFSQTWFDKNLNYEQKKAVDAVQSSKYGDLCYLINGPPGTGKTKTLCEIVAQLGKDPDFQGSILVCAPSNPAADTLALRLRHLFGPELLLRLNDCSRSFPEVPQDLLLHCYVEDQLFSLPPLSTLMRFKIVVTTCQAAHVLVQARVTNRDLLSLQTSLIKSINPGLQPDDPSLHWTALVVDEAAQATEPENLIPLSVVAPPTRSSSRPPIFAMAGDQHQLNPRTYSTSTTLPISLFERLSETPVYADHPLARKNLRRRPPSLTMLRPPFVNLVRNYRSHPAIIAIPSTLFYSNTLIPEADQTHSLPSWTGWRGRGWPVMFSCNSGIDSCEDIIGRGRGWFNYREAQKAISLARSLLDQGLIVELSEICIMSPFQAQVNLLRKLARQAKLAAVNIGPMEAFQGLESRFVIVCTTRARKRFLEEDKTRGIGIIHERKKFNVAITRAKEGLVVLGNPWVLSLDPHWLAFLDFCWRNELWQPETHGYVSEQETQELIVNEWKPKETSHSPVGLEAALLFRESNKEAGSQAAKRFMGGVQSAEDMLWRSGVDAEEALDASYNSTGGTAE